MLQLWSQALSFGKSPFAFVQTTKDEILSWDSDHFPIEASVMDFRSDRRPHQGHVHGGRSHGTFMDKWL